MSPIDPLRSASRRRSSSQNNGDLTAGEVGKLLTGVGKIGAHSGREKMRGCCWGFAQKCGLEIKRSEINEKARPAHACIFSGICLHMMDASIRIIHASIGRQGG